MTAEPSRLTITEVGSRTLALSGIIDSHTTDTFTRQLGQMGTSADVELRLTEITFIDSSGLRGVIAAHQRLDQAGHKLVLSGLSDAVSRLLQITGLGDHLHTE